VGWRLHNSRPFLLSAFSRSLHVVLLLFFFLFSAWDAQGHDCLVDIYVLGAISLIFSYLFNSRS
jgi:hypothetical protein